MLIFFKHFWSLITFYYIYGWHSNCGNTEQRSVQFYGYKFGGIAVFHFSVIMHSFQKKWFQILAHFYSYVQIKNGIEFALSVWAQRPWFLFWDIFCWACSQWRELALVTRKFLPFLIIDANSPHWLQKNETQLCHQIYTHKIVHSSAM